jgi:Amt family ammonium transporter
LLLGFFADTAVNAAGRNGVFQGGGFGLLGEQALAVGATLVFSFVVTYAICRVLAAVLPGGLRVTDEEEETGLDLTLHSEVAYASDRV